MEHINLTKEKITIIVPYKSGHTLLYSTFIHLFKHYNIDFTIGATTDNFLENVYVFVRNPLDRFFSSYNWFEEMYLRGDGDDNTIPRIKKYKESCNITDLKSYIRNYNEFIKICDDYHFLPQTSQILYSSSKNITITKKQPISDIEFEYNKKLGPNYKIFRVEEINDTIKINKDILNINGVGFFNKINNTLFNSDIKIFDFLNPFDDNLNSMFMIFYVYFKNLFDESGHHKKQTYLDKISEEDFCLSYLLIKREFDFFGYKPNEIDVKKLK